MALITRHKTVTSANYALTEPDGTKARNWTFLIAMTARYSPPIKRLSKPEALPEKSGQMSLEVRLRATAGAAIEPVV